MSHTYSVLVSEGKRRRIHSIRYGNLAIAAGPVSIIKNAKSVIKNSHGCIFMLFVFLMPTIIVRLANDTRLSI